MHCVPSYPLYTYTLCQYAFTCVHFLLCPELSGAIVYILCSYVSCTVEISVSGRIQRVIITCTHPPPPTAQSSKIYKLEIIIFALYRFLWNNNNIKIRNRKFTRNTNRLAKRLFQNRVIDTKQLGGVSKLRKIN